MHDLKVDFIASLLGERWCTLI